jgi:hypothetical protein
MMRKALIACVAVIPVLAGGLIALLGPRHCPVNRAAFERIEEGMTPPAVRSILGGPPGDYRTRPTLLVIDEMEGCWMGWSFEKWDGDEGTAEVIFYRDEVVEVKFHDANPFSPGIVELARWRLRKLKGALLP